MTTATAPATQGGTAPATPPAAQDAAKTQATAPDPKATQPSGDAAKASETVLTSAEPVKTEPAKVEAVKDAAKTDDKKAPAVPEKYELKMPAGVENDPAYLEEIAAVSRERGFSNEQAQFIIDREFAAEARVLKEQQTEFDQARAKWVDAVKNDREIGGDNYVKSVEGARRVIVKYASAELKKALNETGLGDHPELIRTFKRIHDEMGEDSFVRGSAAPGGQPKTREDIMFPKDELQPKENES